MSSKVSAGLLMYRHTNKRFQVFLVHPGGPFFRGKDLGVWSIPKGEVQADEDLLQAARREFFEETGLVAHGDFLPLGSVKQAGGKTVHAWAFAGDWDAETGIRSNDFELEWPPRSGQKARFPEIDAAGFYDIPEALQKVNPAQRELILRLRDRLAGPQFRDDQPSGA